MQRKDYLRHAGAILPQAEGRVVLVKDNVKNDTVVMRIAVVAMTPPVGGVDVNLDVPEHQGFSTQGDEGAWEIGATIIATPAAVDHTDLLSGSRLQGKGKWVLIVPQAGDQPFVDACNGCTTGGRVQVTALARGCHVEPRRRRHSCGYLQRLFESYFRSTGTSLVASTMVTAKSGRREDRHLLSHRC